MERLAHPENMFDANSVICEFFKKVIFVSLEQSLIASVPTFVEIGEIEASVRPGGQTISSFSPFV